MNAYMIQGILMDGYEFLALAVPFFVLFVIMRGKRQKGEKDGASCLAASAVFLIYLWGVFHFTGAGTIWEPVRYGMSGGAFRQEEINLIPFSLGIDPVGYGLNVVLFLPFGFLLPFLWKETDSLRKTAAGGFMLSLLIELSQLLNNRSTDVDDLILNTAGAVLGYGAFRMLDLISGGKIRCRVSGRLIRRMGPVLFIAAAFLGRFFFFDEMGAAGFLYGF